MNRARICTSAAIVGLLAAFTGGPGGCSGTTPNNNTNTNTNTNDNAGGDNRNDNSSPDGSPRINVTVHGEVGTEQYMRVLVWVGPRAVSRAEIGDPATLREAGFGDTDINNLNTPGDVSRQIAASPGDVVTIIAVESEGINTGPVSYPDIPDPSDAAVEFVSFAGTPVGSVAPGVATVDGGEDADVIVNFRRMPQIALSLWGATSASVDFDLPEVLGFPGGENPNNRAYNLPGLIAAPDPAVHLTMQYKTGSTVTMAYVPRGEEAPFLRWEGDCSGGGECMLTFGGPSGAVDRQATTLVAVYWRCEFGGPPAYGAGTALDPACTRVEP